jgi:tRNA A-37 threonylcarbamoyl transferase component Bud32
MTATVGVSDQRTLLPGTRFGAYQLLERIGRGGMAIVYKAKTEGPHGFEKVVVVKTLLPQFARNPEFVELFTAEAKTSARLSHPGIVSVYDYGIMDGTPYLVMELVAGVNLQQLMKQLQAQRARVPAHVAIVMMTQVCHALGYAHRFSDSDGHRRQIIHGDVSPSNIMACRDGSVKLLDFGVARVLHAAGWDVSDKLRGKFSYMSPERVSREPYDRRADVFAAGVVLHELLTGRRLFAAPSDFETLMLVQAAEVPPPSIVNPEVSTEIDAVVLKALARDPHDRFDSGEEMAEALEEVSRIGGGRRRVAEYLATVFPQEWYVVCSSCGQKVVPGMACRGCGTEMMGELLPPRRAAPPSLTRIVLPVREPAPPPRRPAPWMAIATSALLLLGGGFGLYRLARWYRAKHVVQAAMIVTPPVTPPPALAIEELPAIEIPPPEPPAPEPPPAPPPPPRRKHGRPKHARPALPKLAPPPAPKPAAPPAPPAPRIKNGRLLDPFGDAP